MSKEAQTNTKRDSRQTKSVYFTQAEKRKIQEDAKRAAAGRNK